MGNRGCRGRIGGCHGRDGQQRCRGRIGVCHGKKGEPNEKEALSYDKPNTFTLAVSQS